MTSSEINTQALSSKLGDVQEYPSGKWILTEIVYLEGVRAEVWTPIPAGEEPENLGKTFHAATLSFHALAKERLTEWPKEPSHD